MQSTRIQIKHIGILVLLHYPFDQFPFKKKKNYRQTVTPNKQMEEWCYEKIKKIQEISKSSNH